jgi:prepilin-type N-terminal cleavage/methylation domain-containing protein
MGRLGGRRGLSLLELAIVIAIIGILAAVAGTLLTDSIPMWRTKRAAREFSVAVQTARQMAIAQGVEYRVRMSAYDTDLSGSGLSTGTYYIEKGNLPASSTAWDILPVDMDGSGTQSGEGTVDITDGGQDELPGVSIEQWDPITGVSGNDLVFSPRGILVNPVSDFGSDGYIEITFVNKRARRRGITDEWTVKVSRSGLARMQATNQDTVGNAPGTADASEWSTSSSSGHAP